MQKPFRAECIMRMSIYSNESFADGRKMRIKKSQMGIGFMYSMARFPSVVLQKTEILKGLFENGDFW